MTKSGRFSEFLSSHLFPTRSVLYSMDSSLLSTNISQNVCTHEPKRTYAYHWRHRRCDDVVSNWTRMIREHEKNYNKMYKLCRIWLGHVIINYRYWIEQNFIRYKAQTHYLLINATAADIIVWVMTLYSLGMMMYLLVIAGVISQSPEVISRYHIFSQP